MLLMLKNILRDFAGSRPPLFLSPEGEIAYLLLCFLINLSVLHTLPIT